MKKDKVQQLNRCVDCGEEIKDEGRVRCMRCWEMGMWMRIEHANR